MKKVKRKAKGKRQNSERPKREDENQDVKHQKDKRGSAVAAGVEEKIQDVIHHQEECKSTVTAVVKETFQNIIPDQEKRQSAVTAVVEEKMQDVIPHQEKRQSAVTTEVNEKIQDTVPHQGKRLSSVKHDGEEEIRSVMHHQVPMSGNFYQIKFKNCQIGNNNTLMQSNRDTGGAALKGVDDSAKTRSKTHTGKLMLQKIYSTNNNKPMLYADLEERLSEYIVPKD